MMFPIMKIGDLVARIPVIQGGMGVGISLSGLASAVANEGGIGVIAAAMIGMNEPDIYSDSENANLRALRTEIRKAREATKGILGVNIMVVLSNFADMVRVSIEEGIDIIFSGAGLPMDLPKYLKEQSKTKLAPIVSSARAAKLLCKKWLARFNYLPDALVLEGPMAGGHLGFTAEEIDNPDFTLEKLLPQVLDAIKSFETESGKKIPVIVAGGVYTGEDICKFLRMGAAGVQMGTRFVATHECDADIKFKETYIAAQEDDLVVIQSPVGMPGRAVRNEFLEDVRRGAKKPFKCPYHCIKTCDYKDSSYCIAFALINAKRGKLKNGFAFAGKNAYRVDKIVSVKELITSLRNEYDQACASLSPNQC